MPRSDWIAQVWRQCGPDQKHETSWNTCDYISVSRWCNSILYLKMHVFLGTTWKYLPVMFNWSRPRKSTQTRTYFLLDVRTTTSPSSETVTLSRSVHTIKETKKHLLTQPCIPVHLQRVGQIADAPLECILGVTASNKDRLWCNACAYPIATTTTQR